MEVEEDTLTCKELVELVTDFLEGALTTEQRARFSRHLVGCSACREYLAQIRETIRVAGTLREEDVTPDALRALQSAFTTWKSKK